MSSSRQPRDVAVIVGSLRDGSYNRKLAHALMDLAPAGMTLSIAEIGELPMYNPDLDGESAPLAWRQFRERIEAADGVLFLTPEYNRSVPGVLKNAIDVASRPRGGSAWQGTPGAVISVSPGALGAFGAHHHLRQMLVTLNVPTMASPEAYIGKVASLFNDDGVLINEGTADFLSTFLVAFDTWISTHLTPQAE